MGYPKVKIHNSTNYPAGGTVSYASAFCSNDTYTVADCGDWEGPGRGVCLLTEISATLTVNGSPVNATPYKSSGTAYSKFAIIQIGDSFVVTRITNALDSVDVGELEAEPTKQQK